MNRRNATTAKLIRSTASLAIAGLLTFLLAVGLGGLNPRSAQAAGESCFATIDGATVYSSADASAVQSAVNAASSGDTVKVAGTCTGVQTVSSETQTVHISKQITLIGGYAAGSWNATPDPVANPTILDANSSGRVAFVTGSGNAILQNLFLRNGSSGLAGGAIFQSRPVTLDTSQISNSTAPAGGAIYSNNSALTITHSSLISNTATSNAGGAIYNGDSTISVEHSTFSNNSAATEGGAIFANTNPVTIRYSTFSNNSAGAGGGAIKGNSTLSLAYSIVANTTTGGDCVEFGAGIVDGGYNLIEDGSCIDAATSQSGDPALGALADNPSTGSGQVAATLTHALLSGSPARGAVPFGFGGCGVVDTTDQRGAARPSGSGCDIGAVEVQNAAPIAVNDSYTPTEDTPFTAASPGVLGNDSDSDGDTLYSSLAHETQ